VLNPCLRRSRWYYSRTWMVLPGPCSLWVRAFFSSPKSLLHGKFPQETRQKMFAFVPPGPSGWRELSPGFAPAGGCVFCWKPHVHGITSSRIDDVHHVSASSNGRVVSKKLRHSLRGTRSSSTDSTHRTDQGSMCTNHALFSTQASFRNDAP